MIPLFASLNKLFYLIIPLYTRINKGIIRLAVEQSAKGYMMAGVLNVCKSQSQNAVLWQTQNVVF